MSNKRRGGSSWLGLAREGVSRSTFPSCVSECHHCLPPSSLIVSFPRPPLCYVFVQSHKIDICIQHDRHLKSTKTIVGSLAPLCFAHGNYTATLSLSSFPAAAAANLDILIPFLLVLPSPSNHWCVCHANLSTPCLPVECGLHIVQQRYRNLFIKRATKKFH